MKLKTFGLMMVALCALWSCTEASQSENQVIAFPEGGEMRQVEALPELSAIGKRRAATFSEPNRIKYFAAFAASDGGAYGFVSWYHSLEIAQKGALKDCQTAAKFSTKDPKSCRIRLTIVPQGYAGQTGLTLSEKAGRAWRRYQSKEGPKAFALGQPSGYASNFARVSVEFSRKQVLSSCNEGTRKTPFRTSCRVIHVAP